jgi:hypothetical protein
MLIRGWCDELHGAPALFEAVHGGAVAVRNDTRIQHEVVELLTLAHSVAINVVGGQHTSYQRYWI